MVFEVDEDISLLNVKTSANIGNSEGKADAKVRGCRLGTSLRRHPFAVCDAGVAWCGGACCTPLVQVGVLLPG